MNEDDKNGKSADDRMYKQKITVEGRRACEQDQEEGGGELACVCHRENKRFSEAQALSLTW